MHISDKKQHNTLSLCFSSSWRSANNNSLLTISKSIEYEKMEKNNNTTNRIDAIFNMNDIWIFKTAQYMEDHIYATNIS